MNRIERDIQVLRDLSSFDKISYVQNTNAIPIIFHITDYEIQSGSTARIYVERSDGSIEYDIAEISGNDVIVDVKKSMFSVAGTSILQIQIVKGERDLVTFGMKVSVKKNHINGGTKSETVVHIFEVAIQEANAAAENANKKAEELQKKADRGDFTGSIRIGTVKTGEAGSAASIKNTGTKKDAVLDITIPKGDKGVSVRLRGQWESGTEYVSDKEYIDLVTYDGSTYGCVMSHTASEDILPTIEIYWICLAERGKTGSLENVDSVEIEFAEAEERENINSGETLPIMLGKIQKNFQEQPNTFRSKLTVPVQTGWLKIAKLPKSAMLRTDIPDSETLTVAFTCTPEDGSGVYDQSCKFVVTETWAGSKIRVLNSLSVKEPVVTQVRKVYDETDDMYYIELDMAVTGSPCILGISFESGVSIWEPINSTVFDSWGGVNEIYRYNITEDSIDTIDSQMNQYDVYEPVTRETAPFTNVLTVSPEEPGTILKKKYRLLQSPNLGFFDDIPEALQGITSVVYRDVWWGSINHTLVTLTEAAPVAGRVWTNFWNTNSWRGWKCNKGITIYEGTINSAGTYQLLDNFQKYKRIQFRCGVHVYNLGGVTFEYEVKNVGIGGVLNLSAACYSGFMPYMMLYFGNDNTLIVTETGRTKLSDGTVDTTNYNKQLSIREIVAYTD